MVLGLIHLYRVTKHIASKWPDTSKSFKKTFLYEVLVIIREPLRSRMMFFLAGKEVLAQLVDELAEQLLLSLGIVVVVRQDVAPDFNLLTGVQLEVRRKFTFLGSINCAMAQFVLGLLGTVHAVESRVDILQHHDCQSVSC